MAKTKEPYSEKKQGDDGRLLYTCNECGWQTWHKSKVLKHLTKKHGAQQQPAASSQPSDDDKGKSKKEAASQQPAASGENTP